MAAVDLRERILLPPADGDHQARVARAREFALHFTANTERLGIWTLTHVDSVRGPLSMSLDIQAGDGSELLVFGLS